MEFLAARFDHPWWVDAFAFLLLALQLPVPLFWLMIHPAIGFWRRRSRRAFIAVAAASWLAMWLLLLLPFGWWVELRFSDSVLLALGGLALVVCDEWLLWQVKRDMNWRVLVGLAELQPERPESRLVRGGIYERIRHPRYLGALLTCWGAVLLTGATRVGILVAFFTALALLVMELEERELLRRLGEDYADYRRQVPRLVPRWKGALAAPRAGAAGTTKEAGR
ncbi:MAG: methyltransferase family protein [Candidatus Acidiferrales bacterium]